MKLDFESDVNFESDELPCLPVGLHSRVSPCTVLAERTAKCQEQGK